MATDFRRIPGAGRRRRGRRSRLRRSDLQQPWVPTQRPSVLRDPRAGRGGRRRPVLTPRRHIPWPDILIALGFVAVGLFAFSKFWSATRVDVALDGISDSSTLTSGAIEGLTVRFAIDPTDTIERTKLMLNGIEVPGEETEIDGDTLLWRPAELGEGNHELALSVPRKLMSESSFKWSFTVDDTPPGIDVPALLPPSGPCEPVTIAGRVEPDSTLLLNGKPLEHDDGRFELRYDRPPAAPLRLLATDRAGNKTHAEVIAPVDYPGVQGVHVTAAAWGYGPLRRGILDLVDAGLVSTVELDLKDEGGIVGYDSQVELAHEVGAVRPEYELRETVEYLKSKGVRVVGRVVAFRDPPMAKWAWRTDRKDWVVQTSDGQMLGAYGGFTNFAHPDVRRYNLAIALEGVEAGIDDILWDYVRRPEGNPANMLFPGLKGSPSDGVVGFLSMTHAALREQCAFQGASVFGIAADRPDAVGQDIPRIARNVDYIAPMLYPSHWVPGEYRVKNPNAQPFDIVKAALADFQAKAAGTGTRLVPWLQDFSMGRRYGPAEVRAQIDAAAALGVRDWLLWNATVRYTRDALDPSLIDRPAEARAGTGNGTAARR